MRRTSVLMAAALLAAGTALPSVATAHPVTRYTSDTVRVSCDSFGGASGTAYFYAEVNTNFGAYAGLAFWEPMSPEWDPPTWVSGEAEVSLDGGALSATLSMYAYSEEPMPEPPELIGTATVTAALEPIGEPESIAERSQGSNQKYRLEGTRQELMVAGEAMLPGDITLQLENCYAVHETISVFATNPDAFVYRSNAMAVDCSWEQDGLFAYLFGWSESGYASADMFITTDEGAFYGSTPDVTLTKGAFSAAFDLFSMGVPEPEPDGIGVAAVPPGPEEPVGSATALAGLSRTNELTRYTDRHLWDKYTFVGRRLAVDGMVQVVLPASSLTLSMDDAACYAESARYQYRSATPNEHAKGPGGGKPLKNDLPENAIPLAVPSSVTVRTTAGTTAEPEVPCTALDPDYGELEYPIGHTAWWTFSGTGGAVTADTAGSSFDTIIGVYVLGGDGYVSLGCVDDVFVEPDGGSLQAAITLATDPGVTYYLQAGGFGGETGQLELSLY